MAPMRSSSASRRASSPRTRCIFPTTFRWNTPLSLNRWLVPFMDLKIRVPHPGDTVAVIGGGPLGLMILHVAALAGYEVIAIVKHDGQVEAAKQLGAAHVVQTGNIRKAIRETRALTPKDRGVDIAIEAVGVPEAWEEAVEMVRKGGTVNFFGGCAVGTHVKLDTNRIHYSDITLRATFHHTPAICRKSPRSYRQRPLPGGSIHHRATLTSTNSIASLKS